MKEIEWHYQQILKYIGENPEREGLKETPKRVAKMYNEIFSGYYKNSADLFKVFESEGYNEMVIVKDIDFFSSCEHHTAPFFGKVHIGYIPNGKVIGLSKLARLVDVYARRLQVQERLTMQIANDIMKYLEPLGCMVVIEAEHLCMKMRGVESPCSSTITSAVRGVFMDKLEVRSEFLGLIK